MEPVQIPLSHGYIAIVDAADAELVRQYHWYAERRGGRNYVVANTQINGRRVKVRLHRLLLQPERGVLVDHKNRNPLDCRRENLRLASDAQNAKNRPSIAGAKSRFKGVFWEKRKGKWRAQIVCGKDRKSLGYFNDEAEAARAYDVAAREWHGEFAFLNF